jgi:hypothetical protein
MQKRSFLLRFKREPASFSLVRFSFSSGLFTLWSPVHFLSGLQFSFSWVRFSFSSYQVHFLFGLRFTFSLVSNSVSLWVYFLFIPGSFSLWSPVHFLSGPQFSFSSGSVQFLFGLWFSISSGLFSLGLDSFSLWIYFLFVTTLYKEKIDQIQRETESSPRENESVYILKSNI